MTGDLPMKVTIERLHGRLVAVTPGLSRMSVRFDAATALLTIKCPECRRRMDRVLKEGETFEVNHRQSCRLERAIRRVVEQHPELVGKSNVLIVLQGGGRQ